MPAISLKHTHTPHTVTSPGVVRLLGLRPPQTQRQEQGETPHTAHMHHDAACNTQQQNLAEKGDCSRRQEVKDCRGGGGGGCLLRMGGENE